MAAVSGGPDSAALLFLLSKLRKKYRLVVSAAHLNHAILSAAPRFEARAREWAAELSIPFYSKTVRVHDAARREKRSLEEAGRLARYRYFKEVARRTRSAKIATAHTLDDQAETMLMRIVRGTGLRGLVAIRPKRPEGDFEIIRPLLGVTKDEILSFLKENSIRFERDPSNRDADFLRNRVRHVLLPLLEKWNPNLRRNLAQQQAVFQEIQDYLDCAAAAALRRVGVARGKLSLEAFRRLPAAMQREVMFKILEIQKGDTRAFTFAHIEALCQLAQSREEGLWLSLPGALRVRKSASFMQVDTNQRSAYNRRQSKRRFLNVES